eukprot:3125992-Pleurochrysis_carterae.AAC.1
MCYQKRNFRDYLMHCEACRLLSTSTLSPCHSGTDTCSPPIRPSPQRSWKQIVCLHTGASMWMYSAALMGARRCYMISSVVKERSPRLLHSLDAASWCSIACHPADTLATYRALDKGRCTVIITRTQMPNVTNVQIILDDLSFWSGLMSKLHVEGHPPPVVMHASPPCAAHSKLANLPHSQNDRQIVSYLLASTLAFKQ